MQFHLHTDNADRNWEVVINSALASCSGPITSV